MKAFIVSSEEEMLKVRDDMAKEGMRVAMISQLGCAPGTMRMTFLPNSAFNDEKKKKGKDEEI